MKDRSMFYQNLNQGYTNPGGFIPPSGYNLNQQYQVYGNNIPSNIPNNQMYYENPNYIEEENQYEQRLNRLEKQYKNLETRVSKLENINTTDDNLYMI